jgi:hypothetical protein
MSWSRLPTMQPMRGLLNLARRLATDCGSCNTPNHTLPAFSYEKQQDSASVDHHRSNYRFLKWGIPSWNPRYWYVHLDDKLQNPHRKAHVTLSPVGPQVGFGVCPGDELDAEYLVGGWPTPLKSDGLNGKDDIPYMKWKIKFMFQTTNQITNACAWLRTAS